MNQGPAKFLGTFHTVYHNVVVLVSTRTELIFWQWLGASVAGGMWLGGFLYHLTSLLGVGVRDSSFWGEGCSFQWEKMWWGRAGCIVQGFLCSVLLLHLLLLILLLLLVFLSHCYILEFFLNSWSMPFVLSVGGESGSEWHCGFFGATVLENIIPKPQE